MAVEDISYAVDKLLEELATNSPNLTASDMTVIKSAIAGEGRLVLTDESMTNVLSPNHLCPMRLVTEEFIHDLLARPRR